LYWQPIAPGFVTLAPNSPVWLKKPHKEAPTAIAANSPLASWSDHGAPARPQYSSVRRGSNMRRKLTLPVEPPVPMMTALRARMFSSVPLWSTAMPSTVPAFGASRRMRVILCSSRISTPARRAATSRGRISPLPEERVFWTDGSAGCPVCTVGQSPTMQCISRGTELPTELPPSSSGALSTNTTPCANSHSKAGALWSAKARMISRSL